MSSLAAVAAALFAASALVGPAWSQTDGGVADSAAAALTAVTPAPVKDLRTKEQRLYDIQLRQAQLTVDKRALDMRTKRSDFEAIEDLYEEKIETLEKLNRAQRDLLAAERLYNQASYELERTSLDFLRDATHIAIREARKYRTLDGRRQVDIILENASQLAKALSLNPDRPEAQIRPLLEIQSLKVSLKNTGGTIIAEPFEVLVSSLPLGQSTKLTFRLLEDYDDVVVALTYQDETTEDHRIILRRESTQDLPTITSVQFSQEGDLNARVNYDLILERLSEDEKTFRLAIVNLPREITAAFVAPGTNANLTQVKFSEDATRQSLELELQIPEKLSRGYVDQTLEFYVFITDTEGFQRIGELNREFAGRPIPLERVNTIPGNKERFELIPRGRASLETIIANRYQEIRTGEEVQVRVDLVNNGTLEVTRAHVVLTPPLDWTWRADPDTIDRILPGETEPVNLTLTPPGGLGVSEYDVRVEALGYDGSERIEAQEKDVTIRVEERADVLRNALIIGAVILLVVGVAVGSIKVSRR